MPHFHLESRKWDAVTLATAVKLNQADLVTVAMLSLAMLRLNSSEEVAPSSAQSLAPQDGIASIESGMICELRTSPIAAERQPARAQLKDPQYASLQGRPDAQAAPVAVNLSHHLRQEEKQHLLQLND